MCAAASCQPKTSYHQCVIRMNAVEIEEAVSTLAGAPFDPKAFPYAFLEAFGNKATTLKRLKSGDSNQSDLPGAVLQRNNIHIKVCPEGEVTAALAALRQSVATARQKAKFILATDGKSFEAENLVDGETVACSYADFHDHFGFFLPLAGITTVRQIRENAFDIKATGRLNRLYIELLKENPDWDTAARRQDLNHFFARIIFCFFAEDTNIFHSNGLFTATIDQMTARDASDTHNVLSEVFRAMNTKLQEREACNFRGWANTFPYVNGNLFSGSLDVPRFSKIARSYLLHVGSLDWTKINPDIFGSMIQAVADDEERGALGMHYTSVPNILKVLNPLFLDDLRARLDDAGDNSRKLLNLRQRITRIRVFDPACGSGNFLVIAYKEMRAIEAEINRRRGEADLRSEIPKTNFRGIEIRDFSCEIARLALVIAEYQCDVLYRGQKLALAEFLPLEAANWITCGNALRLDWLSICPPTGNGVENYTDDLFKTPLDQLEIDFENEGGETYICGNPPYKGSQWQTPEQKSDLKGIFHGRTKNWGSLDYVSGWFMKAADYGTHTNSAAAFVSTNSICQGRQVETLWSLILEAAQEIVFAYTSFKWANLASHNAGVTVVIVGIATRQGKVRRLFSTDADGDVTIKEALNINPYLASAPNVIVKKADSPRSDLSEMIFGNMPNDGGFLLLDAGEADTALRQFQVNPSYIRPFLGSKEFIRGIDRSCIWLSKSDFADASKNEWLKDRFESVKRQRAKSDRATTKQLAGLPFRFGEVRQTGSETVIIVPSVSSESRDYLPAGYCIPGTIVSNLAFALYDAPLWNMALIASRTHLVWIATVCGKLKTDYRYSNTLGWNTFPVPKLTEQNKADLTRCAEDILLAREAHFPATIADLYDPETMPANLRSAHDRNDETLERIYIGRRFKNDTERLEKLFELYTQMTARQAAPKKPSARKTKAADE
jgi:hypothetical protein